MVQGCKRYSQSLTRQLITAHLIEKKNRTNFNTAIDHLTRLLIIRGKNPLYGITGMKLRILLQLHGMDKATYVYM